MLENPIIPKDGKVRAPELPGLGMEIKPEVWTNPAAITRSTTA
jgi:L-alanine-DL-glutamate epimerase-like enolase superfamily enzyme